MQGYALHTSRSSSISSLNCLYLPNKLSWSLTAVSRSIFNLSNSALKEEASALNALSDVSFFASNDKFEKFNDCRWIKTFSYQSYLSWIIPIPWEWIEFSARSQQLLVVCYQVLEFPFGQAQILSQTVEREINECNKLKKTKNNLSRKLWFQCFHVIFSIFQRGIRNPISVPRIQQRNWNRRRWL